jgi:hypothetical protein
MTNQLKKQQHWEKIVSNYKHLDNYCTIEVKGLDHDNIFYHPLIKINGDDVYITGQCDVGNNNTGIYALKFVTNSPVFYSIDIHERLLPDIIIGYYTNKDNVMLAMTTLGNIKKHINTLNYYADEYITHILVGNSIKETTQLFINELDVTNKAIEFIQKQPKKD